MHSHTSSTGAAISLPICILPSVKVIKGIPLLLGKRKRFLRSHNYCQEYLLCNNKGEYFEFKIKISLCIRQKGGHMDNSSLDVAKFGEFEVYNEQCDTVKLASLWNETTAVLVFIRHFG